MKRRVPFRQFHRYPPVYSLRCALSDILATLPDNFANNRIMMAIEYRRRDFYAFEFYRIWSIYNYIN